MASESENGALDQICLVSRFRSEQQILTETKRSSSIHHDTYLSRYAYGNEPCTDFSIEASARAIEIE